MKKNAGFTLIELLVVVLIIGILAAVALPQYQVAVTKSKLAALIPMVDGLTKSLDLYYLENGSWPHSADENIEWTINFPSGCHLNGSISGLCQDGTFIDVMTDQPDVMACSKKEHIGYAKMANYAANSANAAYCLAMAEDQTADQVCRSMGGRLITSRTHDTFRINCAENQDIHIYAL